MRKTMEIHTTSIIRPTSKRHNLLKDQPRLLALDVKS